MAGRDTVMTPVSAALATEIEVAEMVPSLWDLFAELSGTVGLADGAPDLSVPGRLAVAGATSAGRLLLIVEERPASAVESPAVRVSLHSTAGELAEAVHDELVEVAAIRLAPRRAVWRTRFPGESWREHGRLPVPVWPVARWRRRLAGLVDGLLFNAAVAMVGLAVAGLLVHLVGLGRAGLDWSWPEGLLWQTGTGGHAAALVAGAVLARRAGDVVVAVLAPPDPDDWPFHWWTRLAEAVQDVALVALLAVAVVLLGGGWLS
ncbi:hypothetical protein [Frankia sp. ACN1ag]|uniref:hypothetical protein n=1 Tax=Frankia sp. ACN1ag TaxID=102891 RepID=UPI0006DBEA88|nr:hypothetical protein [Frankia sp. ACN1ag]KQC35049.1 hypothetical protein UK82_28750 [Frankia sp. ACN1ag]